MGLSIEDREYSFGVIPPFEAIRVQVAIARVIGEPLFQSLSTVQKGEQLDATKLGSVAIGLITSRMDADEIIATMETVFKYVQVNKRKVIIDSDFNGRPKEMWQVFFAALKFNFNDFISGLPLNLESLGKTE